jgi:predicted Zn-dependent protease with MMP-like domain
LEERLLLAAEQEVSALLRALPKELRIKFAAIPVRYEMRPSRALVRDGVEPDLLGLFVGEAMNEVSADPLPPEVILFLGNIYEYVEHDTEAYREEVRRTLLHEIGHYLGLEEEDLEARGVD